MLTIRMQRTGRSGHAQFRVIVQDSRAHPKSGRVVSYVGSYNPHTKATTIDKDKINTYLSNGAVPSDRVAQLLKKEGLKLPAWYKSAPAKKKGVRNPEKRRSTRPEGEPEPQTQVAEESPAKTKKETETDAKSEEATEENKTEESAVEKDESEPAGPAQ